RARRSHCLDERRIGKRSAVREMVLSYEPELDASVPRMPQMLVPQRRQPIRAIKPRILLRTYAEAEAVDQPDRSRQNLLTAKPGQLQVAAGYGPKCGKRAAETR